MYVNMSGLRTILGGGGQNKKCSKLKLEKVSMLFQHINEIYAMMLGIIHICIVNRRIYD